YLKPICSFDNITNEQIGHAIKKLSPYKAPGPNRISNLVFVNTSELLTLHLRPIFRATFSLKHYPEEWKLLSTVVLHKPERLGLHSTKSIQTNSPPGYNGKNPLIMCRR
ncbi:hypothetical protein BS17DRAFT_697824, partial [Gyrodon lividus]